MRGHPGAALPCADRGSIGRWITRWILVHGTRHPLERGEDESTGILSALAVRRHVSASTQRQALGARFFLSRYVLCQHLGWMEEVARAKRPPRLLAVLTRPEGKARLSAQAGVPWLMASLLYGAGRRLLACQRRRVKDSDCASQ
jgi:hypothetical protein